MGDSQKILWKRPAHPDSYIPPNSFLSSLRKNPNFRPYTYWHVVALSLPATQQLATIFIFLAVFRQLNEGTLDPLFLVGATSVASVLGYSIWVAQTWLGGGYATLTLAHCGKHLRSSILIFLSLLVLSPVLKTLSAATSSDSIYALSAGLFFLNALLGDYRLGKVAPQLQESLISVLSMNAAIASSVVLASRLQQDVAVFALILFSVQVFALSPMLRRRFQHTSHLRFRITSTMVLTSAALFLSAFSFPRSISLLFFMTFAAITFVAPGALIWAQKFKNEIRGPWDVAVPKVN
ncbi:phosphatidylinositol N-acetylglucosaminyltransferase [Cylindrobasidium torrendii FP15055 ss-10]|uniref:Phosphatidylinositol N-acetylglucosaminyltransferase n=1 Tax=Cylindrobasidium torrendii FP15055 ss-10 TaxID=1314674 RepID=A0A0D7BHC3_9AGAR|nr:phosphatidylinositol N-acetylglucosaminyltransferase [Cylindrobasidium torrendii FP15055 ss-10]